MISNNVLSLYDGISIAQVALRELGIAINTYYASEIDPDAIKVTQHHFPKTIQLGDVRNIDGKSLDNIKLICGGSPCTDFSMMGKRRGLEVKKVLVDSYEKYIKLKSEGFEFEGASYLFFEFVRLRKETNAKYFFLENVHMNKKWEKIITKELGVEPVRINSSLLSAQNRDRLYWTNIPNITIPDDKNVLLSDIIPEAIGGAGKRGRKFKGDSKYSYPMTVRKDGKANCLVTCASNTSNYLTKDNKYLPLTVEQMEILQTFNEGYTNVESLSNCRRVKLIGNSWTKDVIKHLFTGLITKKNRYNLFFR